MTKNSAGFPLIEARGYANLRENGVLSVINDTKKLRTKEANWFFNDIGEGK